VITASEPSWIAPFTGLSPRQFDKLITALRREGADPVRKGRPWSLPLEDRVLLVAAYWRTNLTLRQLAPLFGISKSAADRIVGHLGPSLAPARRRAAHADRLPRPGHLPPADRLDRRPVAREHGEAMVPQPLQVADSAVDQGTGHSSLGHAEGDEFAEVADTFAVTRPHGDLAGADLRTCPQLGRVWECLINGSDP
jgi:hypothetical protein